ncbi:hypothetical protein RA276_29105, partial [Pseudomonas syringae pv. tagetis]|uniref:hypothetical protein n=1 Tax=Pseudomonas syringae group genomosp. 7 TaxID=251699 RepID=UPI00376F8369
GGFFVVVFLCLFLVAVGGGVVLCCVFVVGVWGCVCVCCFGCGFGFVVVWFCVVGCCGCCCCSCGWWVGVGGFVGVVGLLVGVLGGCGVV